MRDAMRQRRRALSPAQRHDAARAIADAIAACDIYAHARTLAAYWPCDGEIDPLPLLRRARQCGKRAYLPRIVGRRLEFAPWGAKTPMADNKYGIPEPQGGQPRTAADLDLLLCPLVAADASGNRLGMGGGYYDRTLADCAPGHPATIGLGYAFQIVEHITPDPHDIQMQHLATEQGLLYIA